MSNAIAKNEASVPQVQENVTGGEDILSNDIVVPRILLMQGLSDFVNDRKAAQGDIVRSTPFQILGNPDKPVDFIPITFNNQWLLQEVIGKQKEFRGYEPMTPQNQDLPWTFQKNGAEWMRTKVINVYGLLPADIAAEREEMEKAKKGEMPDPDKALLPVLISFRITSYNAGKDVVTHFAKARKFGMPGYVSVLRLSTVQDKNDSGTFYVYKTSTVGKSSKEDQEVAAYWHGILKTQKVKVDFDESEGLNTPRSPGEAEY